jgi:hypothetical protein
LTTSPVALFVAERLLDEVLVEGEVDGIVDEAVDVADDGGVVVVVAGVVSAFAEELVPLESFPGVDPAASDMFAEPRVVVGTGETPKLSGADFV